MHGLEDAISDTIAMVWSSTLGIDVRQTDAIIASNPGDGATLVGCIHITGPAKYAIALRSSESLARYAATVMFNIDARDASTADAQDALGELTNITGGNVKALLPEGHQLSLPTVVAGRDFRTILAGGRRVGDLAFDCRGESLVAMLYVGSEA